MCGVSRTAYRVPRSVRVPAYRALCGVPRTAFRVPRSVRGPADRGALIAHHVDRGEWNSRSAGNFALKALVKNIDFLVNSYFDT